MKRLLKVLTITGVGAYALAVLLLIALSVPFSGWKALSVSTGSMRPAIAPGALVFVHRVPDHQLQVGDVITYTNKERGNQTITHRIVGIKPSTSGPNQFIVKGDANPVADAAVSPSQIVGRIDYKLPVAGRVVDFLHKPLGLLLVVYIPALLLAIYEIKLLVQRLTRLEIEKKLKATKSFTPPKPSIAKPLPLSIPPAHRTPAPPRANLDGIKIMAVFGLLLTIGVTPTRSNLNTQAKLTGTTIATVPITTPPPCGTGGNTNSTNSVTVINSTDQNAVSGDANSNNSTNTSAATSGNVTNNSSTSTTINLSNQGC